MKRKPPERLSDILKRFRRLSYTSQIFATEHDAKNFGHVHPEELREMLLHELRFLKGQHEAFEKVWTKSFKELETALKRSKDGELRERLRQVHKDLAIIRRSLFRSELAGWSDRELLDEWSEWERMKSFGDESATRLAIRQERQELLRSELTLRGHGRKFETASGMPLSDASEKKEVDASEPRIQRAAAKEEVPHASRASEDFFEEWDREFRSMIEKEALYWQSALEHLEKERALGDQGLPVLKKRKHAEAEKRLLKRAYGY